MAIEAQAIVTVNAGSSSIKASVFIINGDLAKLSRLVDVSINISQSTSTLQIAQPDMPLQTEATQVSDHMVGTQIIVEKLMTFVPINKIVAVGHRLVHGGIKHTHTTPIEKITENDWQTFEQLDPKHTPAARYLINYMTRHIPSALQVACFDTTFFQKLPYVAKILPIPKKYYEVGLRRYGFHGLSYTSILASFRERAGEVAANGRVILAHLGGGVSMTAMSAGKPVDTTMGFTPTSGLVMSTRSGDLDPNVFSFLHRKNNMSLEQFEHMVSAESGLVGVSGITGDMRQLLETEAENSDAKAAIELFVQNIKKSIGAFSAVLGGVDSIIFSGGIGEQSSVLRTRICQGLEYLGITLDETMNKQNDFLISNGQSRVGVHVIPSDEARVIAEQTIELLNTSRKV